MMDLKTINKRISYVRTNAAKMNAYIQETAVGIIEHAKEHGDCNAALRLVQALPKSYRRGLLINWFALYSPIGMNVNTGKVGFTRDTAKSYNPFNLDGARLNNRFESKEAEDENLPDTTLEETNKLIFGLASRLQKRLDEGQVPAEDKPAVTSQIVALKKLGRTVRPVPVAAPTAMAA